MTLSSLWKEANTDALGVYCSSSLVAKVTHADLTARIRCMQVLYVHGANALPWVVIATSNGTVQIWDLAAFKLDALAPEEANAHVVPVTSTVLMSKPRLTCLTACLSDEGVAMPVEKKAKKSSASKKPSTVATTKAASAAAPRVVVELDDAATSSKQQKRSADDSEQQQSASSSKRSKKSKNKKVKTA